MRRLLITMRRLLIIVPLVFSLLVAGCEATTAPPPRTCEDKFDDALIAGVSYTEALGDYTQCLIDEGRVLGLALDLLELIFEQIGTSTWQQNSYSTNRH